MPERSNSTRSSSILNDNKCRNASTRRATSLPCNALNTATEAFEWNQNLLCGVSFKSSKRSLPGTNGVSILVHHKLVGDEVSRMTWVCDAWRLVKACFWKCCTTESANGNSWSSNATKWQTSPNQHDRWSSSVVGNRLEIVVYRYMGVEALGDGNATADNAEAVTFYLNSEGEVRCS
jgi:hypothetical protein